jgi:hypothetical protein
MTHPVEIKKTFTNEANISDRTISYDIYVDGAYKVTVNDIIEALQLGDKYLIKNELKSLNLLQLKTKQRQAKSKVDLLLKFSEGQEAMDYACDVLRFTSLEIRNRQRKFND